MFTLKKEIGEHKIYSYDKTVHNFKEYLETLYNCSDLSKLYEQSKEYSLFLDGTIESLENVETDIHKKFYTDIKSNTTFKKLYCSFVKDIYKEFFSEEPFLIYQSFPSIRFQFIGNKAIPPHCDSDDTGKHPIGEKNFLVPITDMKDTTCLFIESSPNKGDFTGIPLEHGELFYFNGNKCIHYNETNKENYMRISFDFRVLTQSAYINYIKNYQITTTNPRDLFKERKPTKMIIGGYYQVMSKDMNLEKTLEWFINDSFIMQTRPSFDSSEALACSNYFTNGDPFLTEFKETEKLEKRLAEFIGVNHCYMVPSGTSAIITALLACNIKAGDDVIVPNFTMIATANAVKLLGANPILVDVNRDTFTLDLETVKANITSKTKAVIHVSLNNRNKDLQELANYLKENNLYLIEDAAQSLGAFSNGQHYGTFGDIGCFSLSSPKIITTGQGGFLVTNNKELASRIFKIKNFGRSSGGVEQYDVFGVNFKFTDIQAVIGLAQVDKLSQRVERMKEIYKLYYDNLNSLKELTILPSNDPGWIPWFIDIIVKDREGLMYFLKQHNVQTRVTYPSIHATEPYSTMVYSSNFTNSLHISTNGIFLPTHFLLTNKDIVYICSLIKLFLQTH
jgi:perosamine synthetase